MRRFAILCFLLLGMPAKSQKVKSDIVENGIRTISASLIYTYDAENDRDWIYSLFGHKYVDDDFIEYGLGIALSNTAGETFPQNPGLLFRLFDGTVIKIRCHDVSKAGDNKIIITTAFKEAAIPMLKIGVKKIRVETDDGYVEKEYDEDKCGERLYESYVNIKQEFEKPPRSFSDGF